MTRNSRPHRAAVTKPRHHDLPTVRDRLLLALGLAAMFLLIVALNLATADRRSLGAAPSIEHENVHA